MAHLLPNGAFGNEIGMEVADTERELLVKISDSLSHFTGELERVRGRSPAERLAGRVPDADRDRSCGEIGNLLVQTISKIGKRLSVLDDDLQEPVICGVKEERPDHPIFGPRPRLFPKEPQNA